jgi:hypothetical protein
MPAGGAKRKVFLSFFQGDRAEVDQFIDTWSTRHVDAERAWCLRQ